MRSARDPPTAATLSRIQRTIGGTTAMVSANTTRSARDASRKMNVSGLAPKVASRGWAIANPQSAISSTSRWYHRRVDVRGGVPETVAPIYGERRSRIASSSATATNGSSSTVTVSMPSERAAAMLSWLSSRNTAASGATPMRSQVST